MNSIRSLRRPAYYGALLVSTVAYYTVPWRASPAAGAWVGVPFVLLYCVFVPGFSLFRRFARGSRDGLQTTALTAFYGFAVLLGSAFVWALSGVSLAAFAYALPVLVVSIGLSAPWERRRAPRPAGALESRRGRLWTRGLAAAAVGVGALVLWSGPPIDYGKDTLDYVAYTNEVARTGDPFPTTEFYADAGPYGTDLRKGLLHALYGYFKWYLGIDTLTLFRGLGAIFLVLVISAVYTAGRTFFPGRAVAALSGIFFMISFDGGLRYGFIRSYFYPNLFGIGYLLLFLASALEYMGRPRPRGLVLCAVFAFAAAATHIQYVVLLGVAVATIVVWKTCFETGSYRAHLSRSLSMGVAAFMGMLPYGFFRYLTAFRVGGASELHRQIQAAVFVWDGWFIGNPLHAWQSVGPLGAAAVLAIVPLWRRRREYPALGYLIASLLTVILLQFNPLITPVLYHFITYLVYRLGIASPYYILAAYFVVTVFRPQRAAAPAWGPYRATVLIVMLAAIAAAIAPAFGRNAFSPSTTAAERQQSYLRWEPGLLGLRSLPEGSIIASDPVTSYAITAFTPHKVVCTLDQHAPPSDLLGSERTIAARDILSPFTSASDKVHQADAFHATHVVVNENLGPLRMCDYWTVTRESAPMITRRLDALDAYFSEEQNPGALRVYRVTGKTPRQVAVIRNPLLRRRVPASSHRVAETAGLARLEAATIAGADSVASGGAVDVTLYWMSQEALPLDKYIVTLRFDREDLRLPLGGWPFPKLARKLKESFDGVRYRFRSDHMIIDGFLSPDTWPPDVFVVDRATVRIPGDVAAGRYTVRAKLLTRITSPNYRIHDLLYDNDVFEGTVIGEITIGRMQ